jgi:TolB protein
MVCKYTCFLLLTAVLTFGCAKQESETGQQNGDSESSLSYPGETHLANIRQLTFEGENAEAYFSFDESLLTFQARWGGMECDQIFTMGLDGSDITRVSSGKGRTTCSYWLADGEHIIFSSTEAHDPGCLPSPDRSKGYVWKLYPEFDIYVIRKDGTGLRTLFASDGYDAEATVSPDGKRIVFTSTRDGDPELYTMAIDGSDVRRLTYEKGYDGGAFYSYCGNYIVFRASRPGTEEELAAYHELVTEHLVRPTALEIFVMNTDGSGMRQVTNNGKANFGPFMHPDGKRIIFSSNMDSDNPRRFNLYMINIDGTGLKQITFSEEFDGFPMFSRDGKKLVFSSNRNNSKPGDTNVFIADWVD